MKNKILVCLLLCAYFASGCSDPYEARIPKGEILTEKELKDLSSKLEQADKDIFKRWADRKRNGETLGGELTAWTVKDAITNQRKHEEEQRRLEEKKIAAEKKTKAEIEEKIRLAKADNDERIAVDAAIKRLFEVRVLKYTHVPVLDRSGYEVAREWRFLLGLTNKSDTGVIGFSGWVTIHNVFNQEVGTYPVRVETNTDRLSASTVIVSMPMNKQDPGQIEMLRSSQLKLYFFLENLAFANGKNLDKTSLSKTSEQKESSEKTAKIM